MWCLAQQAFDSADVQPFLPRIMEAVKVGAENQWSSVTLELETVRLLKRLLCKMKPRVMRKHREASRPHARAAAAHRCHFFIAATVTDRRHPHHKCASWPPHRRVLHRRCGPACSSLGYSTAARSCVAPRSRP